MPLKWRVFLCDCTASPPLGGTPSTLLFRLRVSASSKPSPQLGFLNLINTVSGNCLVSDLEQHASLLPFLFLETFCSALDPQLHPPAGLIALAGSFYEYPKDCSPSDLSSVPSLASMLIHWWAGIQAPPPSEWSVRLWLLQEGDAELSHRGPWQVWRPACLCHRRTWGPSWEAAFAQHPVTLLPVSASLAFCRNFRLRHYTANSTGVVRQPVTQTETEVSPRRLSLFYWQRLLALLRGIPCCLRWVAVGNGVNVNSWNLPSTFSDY